MKNARKSERDRSMNDFVYRYTCRKCGAVREVRTLRGLTADQKWHIRQSDCPVCQLKGIEEASEQAKN